MLGVRHPTPGPIIAVARISRQTPPSAPGRGAMPMTREVARPLERHAKRGREQRRGRGNRHGSREAAEGDRKPAHRGEVEKVGSRFLSLRQTSLVSTALSTKSDPPGFHALLWALAALDYRRTFSFAAECRGFDRHRPLGSADPNPRGFAVVRNRVRQDLTNRGQPSRLRPTPRCAVG
jgi:hypothetical protein